MAYPIPCMNRSALSHINISVANMAFINILLDFTEVGKNLNVHTYVMCVM